MFKTVKAPRLQATKTPTEVQGMLYDIATVLRLTAMVKGEMIRDQAEADRKVIESRRTSRLTETCMG